MVVDQALRDEVLRADVLRDDGFAALSHDPEPAPETGGVAVVWVPPPTGVKGRISQLREWWANSRIGRTLLWYRVRGGAQLAGGIAYAALFSMISALTIGYSVLNALMGRNPALSEAVTAEISRWLPGLYSTSTETPLSPASIHPLPNVINPASITAVIVLLFSAIGMTTAIRTAVRAMFTTTPIIESPVRSRLAALAGFILLGFGLIASAASSIGTEALGHFFDGRPGLQTGLQLISGFIGVPLDTLVVATMIRFVSGVKPAGKKQRSDFWIGSIVAAIVATLLRVASTQIVVFAAGRNLTYLAQFSAIITVLVLSNLLARTLLYVCAWIKDPPRLDLITVPAEIGDDFFD
jgi:membrane protein